MVEIRRPSRYDRRKPARVGMGQISEAVEDDQRESRVSSGCLDDGPPPTA